MNRAILQGYSLKRYHMKYMRILTFCLEGCFLSQNTSTYSDWCQNDLKMINKTAMIFGLILYFLNVKKSSKTVFMKNIYHLFLLNEVDIKVVLNRNLQKQSHFKLFSVLWNWHNRLLQHNEIKETSVNISQKQQIK